MEELSKFQSKISTLVGVDCLVSIVVVLGGTFYLFDCKCYDIGLLQEAYPLSPELANAKEKLDPVRILSDAWY